MPNFHLLKNSKKKDYLKRSWPAVSLFFLKIIIDLILDFNYKSKKVYTKVEVEQFYLLNTLS